MQGQKKLQFSPAAGSHVAIYFGVKHVVIACMVTFSLCWELHECPPPHIHHLNLYVRTTCGVIIFAQAKFKAIIEILHML